MRKTHITADQAVQHLTSLSQAAADVGNATAQRVLLDAAAIVARLAREARAVATLRDTYAAAALSGLLASGCAVDEAAHLALSIADAVMSAR